MNLKQQILGKISRPNTILLPVETISREFDAKLHLALRAAARGWRVIIGGRAAINEFLPNLPRSIYISKGIRVGNRLILRHMEEFGHIVVALDEEALIRQSDEALLMMIDEETFNRPRLLFAWGKSNADVWRSFQGYQGTPILEIGNPRVDLLRPELSGYFAEEVTSLKQKYGRYILFSTNFSMVNHFIPNHIRFKTAEGIDQSRAELLKSGLVAHKARIFEAFRDLIPAIADAIAPVNLVIRPHPSENPATWVAAARQLENVHVIHEGPIGPWLMAAEALVQNGCTSAVEAAIVGTPALAFRPYVSDSFEVELSNRMSIDCRTADQLIAAMKKIVAADRRPVSLLDSGQVAFLQNHIASINGALSCERLLDSLDVHADKLSRPEGPGGLRRMLAIVKHYRHHNVRDAINRLRGKRKNGAYSSQKFPGMTDEMIDTGIGKFRAILPELPALRRQKLAKHIFAIERDPGMDV